MHYSSETHYYTASHETSTKYSMAKEDNDKSQQKMCYLYKESSCGMSANGNIV